MHYKWKVPNCLASPAIRHMISWKVAYNRIAYANVTFPGKYSNSVSKWITNLRVSVGLVPDYINGSQQLYNLRDKAAPHEFVSNAPWLNPTWIWIYNTVSFHNFHSIRVNSSGLWPRQQIYFFILIVGLLRLTDKTHTLSPCSAPPVGTGRSDQIR